ncbi:MAG: AAA family ATPase [Bacilli bacterium]|nr:AAA family ATPase [Bacilli bacterium]
MLKVCLTGGPSTGKTSVINAINKHFSSLGYNVIIAPETATSFIQSGIRPFGDNALPSIEFQRLVIQNQLHNEKICEKASEVLGKDKSIIICDRGALDGIAYVNEQEWKSILEKEGIHPRDLLTSYDVVLYMLGKSEIFTTENNKSRYESSADEALEKGKKVLKSYLSHDNLRVIQPREDIKDKELEVINIIANMLKLPTRVREQHKFLVDGIDVEKLASLSSKVVIKQDYLRCDDDTEYRIRRIEQNGIYSYHFSVIKKCVNGIREILTDDVISESAYRNLLLTKSDNSISLTKTRYSFVHDQQYFKLDIFDDDMCILEVNLTKENPNISIPDFVYVVQDVTNDEEYQNINIARGKMTTYGKREDNNSRGNRLLREGNSI